MTRSRGKIKVPELVRIPAGFFLMGSRDDDPDATVEEKPQHQLYLPEYWIGRYPVTNEEYRAFLLANPDHGKSFEWANNDFLRAEERHPVVDVTWDEAMDYCFWLSDVAGKVYILPREAEWEKAARGTDGRIYPWGNIFDPELLIYNENRLRHTASVGICSPEGYSPYGCVDMAGNVLEWT